MQSLQDDRKILKILCNDLYYFVVNIVDKYSERQQEKTICKEEEVLVRSIYRDFFDSDIFKDFDLLYKNDCFIVKLIQNTEENNAKSFRDAINAITKYIQEEDNKRDLAKIATKYQQQNRYEWIFTQAIKKIHNYSLKLNDQECLQLRTILLNLIIQILEFDLKDK